VRRVKPQADVDLSSGEVRLSFGKGAEFDPTPIAPDVFALPGEVAKNGGFRMAICLAEFQQIHAFNGKTVENALRNAVQVREVGYVFAGSQPPHLAMMVVLQAPLQCSG
jgi:hypothetical protein